MSYTPFAACCDREWSTNGDGNWIWAIKVVVQHGSQWQAETTRDTINKCLSMIRNYYYFFLLCTHSVLIYIYFLWLWFYTNKLLFIITCISRCCSVIIIITIVTNIFNTFKWMPPHTYITNNILCHFGYRIFFINIIQSIFIFLLNPINFVYCKLNCSCYMNNTLNSFNFTVLNFFFRDYYSPSFPEFLTYLRLLRSLGFTVRDIYFGSIVFVYHTIYSPSF